MKNWILTLGVSLVAFSPFSLRAEEEMQPCDQHPLHAACAVNTEEDFSEVLGSEILVNYLYNFFDRFAVICEELDEKVSQLTALYPGEPVSLSWERDMHNIRTFLANKDTLIKTMILFQWGFILKRLIPMKIHVLSLSSYKT